MAWKKFIIVATSLAELAAYKKLRASVKCERMRARWRDKWKLVWKFLFERRAPRDRSRQLGMPSGGVSRLQNKTAGG